MSLLAALHCEPKARVKSSACSRFGKSFKLTEIQIQKQSIQPQELRNLRFAELAWTSNRYIYSYNAILHELQRVNVAIPEAHKPVGIQGH